MKSGDFVIDGVESKLFASCTENLWKAEKYLKSIGETIQWWISISFLRTDKGKRWKCRTTFIPEFIIIVTIYVYIYTYTYLHSTKYHATIYSIRLCFHPLCIFLCLLPTCISRSIVYIFRASFALSWKQREFKCE